MPFLFLLPAAAFLIVFMAVPVVDAILLSFQRWDGLTPATWVGLRNYRLLLEDRVFVQALRNTVYFTLATVILQTTIPLLVANLINTGIKGGALFRLIFFLPVIISLTITGMLWRMILEPNFGMLNEMLRNIGLKDWTQLWLADRDLVIPCIIFVSVWQSLGLPRHLFRSPAKHPGRPRGRVDRRGNAFRFRHIIALRTLSAGPEHDHGIKVFDQGDDGRWSEPCQRFNVPVPDGLGAGSTRS